VHAYAVHPGLVGTDLMRYLSDDDRTWLDKRIAQNGVVTKSPEQGAATTVYDATASGLDGRGGSYLEDCHVSDTWAAHAHDPEAAARLWDVSEQLTGERFPA
jgi:hypothetical protein